MNIKWCQNCLLPDTRPHLRIGPDGVCNACANHSTKKMIDWTARRAQLRAVVDSVRTAGSGYDCLIPVSGGKDSTWQTVQCLELGLKPLAVTWKPPGRTEVGRRNLENLIALGVDHIDYAISPGVERRFMLQTFERYGSTAIPMHLALFNIPLTLAVRLRIPLVVWGENSAFEYGSADDADTGFRLDHHWLKIYGVTHGTTAADWVSETLTAKELTAYFGPSEAELAAVGVRAIFLGYYLPWDPEITRQVAARHGFRSESAGPRTGYYDFADIDDEFISLHHWLKWYKFGFTRLFDNLSLEIRNGRMRRAEALEIVRTAGDPTPWADIERFCRFADIKQARFLGIAERFRNPAIWRQRADGVWHIPQFLLPDWKWGP